MQVRVTTLTESKVDYPLVSLTGPVGDESSQSEIRFGGRRDSCRDNVDGTCSSLEPTQ